MYFFRLVDVKNGIVEFGVPGDYKENLHDGIHHMW